MNNPSLDKLMEAAEDTPLVRYVNCILIDMHQRGMSSRELRQSEPLPSLDTLRCSTPTDFSHVLNRLKVMSDLNPVTYPEPVDGRFKVQMLGKRFKVEARFDDNPEDPYVRLEMKEDCT
jgi:hypothetical protein